MNDQWPATPPPSPYGDDDGPPVYNPQGSPTAEPPLAPQRAHASPAIAPPTPPSQTAPAVAPPHVGPSISSSVDGPTPGNRTGRRKKALIAVGAVCVVALAGTAGLSLVGGADGGNDLVLVDDGDVHIVEPGEPADRSNRVFSEAGYYPQRMFVFEEDGGIWTPLVTVGGRDLLLMRSDADGETVLVATVNGGEPEELITAEDLFVRADGDMLQVVATQSGTKRCYAGGWNDVANQRLFRGDECRFARSGHLMGFDYGEEVELALFAPDGSLQLELELESDPIHLTDDGRRLVSYDYESSEVVVTDTSDGNELARIEAMSADIQVIAVSNDLYAIGYTNLDAESAITVIDDQGNTSDITQEPATIQVQADGNGALYWTESFGDSDSLYRWDATTHDVTMLAEDDRIFFDLTTRGVAAAKLDGRRVEVVHFDDDGSELELWDHDEANFVRVDTLENQIAVIAYAEEGDWAGALLSADGDDPIDYEGPGEGPYFEIQDHWLFLSDWHNEEVIALHSKGTVTEVEVDGRSYVQAQDGILFVDRDENYAAQSEPYSAGDVLAFDLSSGEEIADLTYHGFRLAIRTEVPERSEMYLSYSEFNSE